MSNSSDTSPLPLPEGATGAERIYNELEWLSRLQQSENGAPLTVSTDPGYPDSVYVGNGSYGMMIGADGHITPVGG